MQYLFPYIVSDELIDRYDIWVNTTDSCDIMFFKMMARMFPKINLVRQPDGVVNGIASINKFYTLCQDDDTIYIKIDDDVVWMEPGIFRKILTFRTDNPDAFLVSPMVVNNAICSYLWQITGRLDFGKYMNAAANHRILWKRGGFALALHRWFLDKLNNNYASYEKLHIGRRPIACNRFSINFISWFGRDMAAFNGVVPGDDEEYLSVIRPAMDGKINLFDGDSIIAHFAFRPQREILDEAGILEQYGEVLQKEFAKDPAMAEVAEKVNSIIAFINDHADDTHDIAPFNYETVPEKKSSRTKAAFKACQKRIRDIMEKKKIYTIKDNTL